MDQPIISSASSQTISAAQKAAGENGKSSGRGIFAKLLAIIEGRAKGDNSDGAGKLFKHSANGVATADPATPKARSAAASLLAIEKSADKATGQKGKAELKESADVAVADAGLTASNDRIHPAGLAGRQAAPVTRGTEMEESAANGDTDRKLKNKAGDKFLHSPAINSREANEVAARVKIDSEAGSSPVAASKEANEIAAGAKADAAQPVKSSSVSETAHAAVTPSAEVKESTTPRIDVIQRTKAHSESMHAATNSSGEMSEVAAGAKANLNQPEKTRARPVALSSKDIEEIVSKSDFNRPIHGRTAPEAGGSTAASAPQTEEAMASARADINKPSRSRPATEAGQNATASVQGKEPAATAPGKPTPRETAARTEPLGQADEKPVEGMKAAMQQATSTSMQSEKGIFMQPGTNTVSATASAAQEQRFSTNSFMKSRKINLHHTSRADNARQQQAGADRKPEVQPGNPRLPAMQASESFAANMKEVMAQTESLPRSGQPPELANGQTFQANSVESSSSAMRPGHQPTPSMSSSGPWSVMAAMQQIGQAAAQGKFQLELTLTPEHLGKVQVFLDSDVNKQIQVHLVVDQPTSRQSIEQHIPALRQALADQGLNMDSFSMTSSGQGKENQQQHERQNRHLPTEAIMANSQGGSAQRPQAAADSRLSIRI